MVSDFQSHSVKQLQDFLKDRGIIFSNQKKCDLIHLCSAEVDLGVQVDHDGLIEDMDEILTEKLSLPSGRMIKNPLIIQTEGSKNIAVLPKFQLQIFSITILNSESTVTLY